MDDSDIRWLAILGISAILCCVACLVAAIISIF